MKKRIAILISGRGSNMEAIAKNVQSGILKNCCNIVLVLANKQYAQGLKIAHQMGIQTACIVSKGKTREEFDKELVTFLEQHHLDYLRHSLDQLQKSRGTDR